MKRKFSGLNNDIRSESGQTLVLVALSMTVLMGFLGLAIDVGNLRAVEHKLQQAADSAALAGALEMNYCAGTSPCTQMTTDATKAVKENGLSTPALSSNTCSGTGSGLSLFVNWGPCLLGANDPNNGSKSVVEALVAQDVDMYFARALGLNTVRLSARAEAGKGNSSFCMFVGAAHPGSGTLSIDSGGQLTLTCGIQVDGSLSAKGNGSHVTATEFQVTGSSGNGSNQFTPSPVFNAPTVPDPICAKYDNWGESSQNNTSNCSSQVYQAPAPSNCQTVTTPFTGGTLPSGCYQIASGCTPLASNKGGNGVCDAITLGANTILNGTYEFYGNVDLQNYNLSSDATNGTTMYFKNGSIINAGGSRVSIAAPTTNVNGLEGMLVWQDPNNSATLSLASGSSSVWNGILYAPDATIDLSSGGTSTTCATGQYSIIDALNVSNTHGGKTFNICSDYSQLADGDPIQGYTAVLVE